MWHTIPVLRAFGQKASQVVVRRPGHRFLSAPEPIATLAKEHWEFAWLSVAAYLQTPSGQTHIQNVLAKTAAPIGALSPDPLPPLTAAGWTEWKTFPGNALLAKIKQSHLRVQVWERHEPPAVAVTFGGTVFNNDADWRANLRWFLPGRTGDEYTEVVQTFAPAFDVEFKRRAQSMDRERLSRLEIYSTGHSLGGGLAQQFSYSLPLDCLKRVKQVYAFDASPVTGFFSVAQGLRDANKKGLLIDRIYERGEILALLRSLTSLFYKPSAINAAIRGVRYNLFRAWNPIAAHSIDELAEKLDAARRGATPISGRVPLTPEDPFGHQASGSIGASDDADPLKMPEIPPVQTAPSASSTESLTNIPPLSQHCRPPAAPLPTAAPPRDLI
jgi:hypothetical protein